MHTNMDQELNEKKANKHFLLIFIITNLPKVLVILVVVKIQL